MKRKAKNRTLNMKTISLLKKNISPPPKNKIAENKLIIKILAYSAKKIKAKPADPYSILNPETSSDSPSAKSKGARLVSATQVTNQIKETGSIRKLSHIVLCNSLISRNLKVPTRNNGKRRVRAILTS